jgi:hypothetical protein
MKSVAANTTAWVSPPTIDCQPTSVPGLGLLLLEHDFSGGFRQFLGAACGLSSVSHPGDAVMALKVKAGLWKLGLRQRFRPQAESHL